MFIVTREESLVAQQPWNRTHDVAPGFFYIYRDQTFLAHALFLTCSPGGDGLLVFWSVSSFICHSKHPSPTHSPALVLAISSSDAQKSANERSKELEKCSKGAYSTFNQTFMGTGKTGKGRTASEYECFSQDIEILQKWIMVMVYNSFENTENNGLYIFNEQNLYTYPNKVTKKLIFLKGYAIYNRSRFISWESLYTGWWNPNIII